MTRLRSSVDHSAEPDGNEPLLTKKALKLVREAVHRHFDSPPRRLRARGGGLTNTVVEFEAGGDRYVLRMHTEPAKLHDYLKEQWAMDAARAAGVPTPQVLEVSSLADGRPYMISEHVEGKAGIAGTGRIDRLAELGSLAALLHGVRTHGYGGVFDWSSNLLSKYETWGEWLDHEFAAEARIETLRRHRVLDAALEKQLLKLLAAARRWRKAPALQHGDLRLKNVIVHPKSGRIAAVIDWETCVSLPAPWFDLSIALHELGIDEKEAFLDGYGITGDKMRDLVPFVRMWNVLGYSHAVERAAKFRDRPRMEWFRLRLGGGLDLYREPH